MADQKETPNEREIEDSLPLPFETGVDKSSPLGSAGRGEQTGGWDRELLRPFVPLSQLATQAF